MRKSSSHLNFRENVISKNFESYPRLCFLRKHSFITVGSFSVLQSLSVPSLNKFQDVQQLFMSVLGYSPFLICDQLWTDWLFELFVYYVILDNTGLFIQFWTISLMGYSSVLDCSPVSCLSILDLLTSGR